MIIYPEEKTSSNETSTVEKKEKRYVDQEIENVIINTFFKQIGIEEPDVQLKNDLHKFVNKKFKNIHCCVISFRDLKKEKSEISKILASNSITPKYKKFSIIATYNYVELEEDLFGSRKKLFQNMEAKNFSTESSLCY